jgi:5'-AMP-activated protein kinase catalytic alpha subunit
MKINNLKDDTKQLESLKQYLLKEDIGEGNFGKMKLAVYKPTGEEYAIKILNKEIIKQKMKNVDFKENEIITKFHHINIVNVFELIEDKENFYIVMEYCQKGELFDYIVAKKRLSEDEASIFFYQLINGVNYIHSKEIAHRDLKPENLLLTNDKILKIIDFGLSHEYDGNILLKTKCGSPSYAAPELIKGKHYDGFQIDVWCCGIVLYAMVCGYLPFEGETNKELFKNILECNPEIPDNLSKSCKKLLKSILVVDPNKRITVEGIMQSDFYLKGKELCKKHYDFNLEELDRKSYTKKTDEKYNDNNNNNKETDNHNKECNTNTKESNDNNNKEINSNEKKK